MKARQAEGVLALSYASATILSVVSLVSLVTAWQHWAWTLDVCINVDCGCILYGINTFSTFMGGDVKLCHFATYSLVPAILLGLFLAAYHGYRRCIDRNPKRPRRVARETAFDESRDVHDGQVVVVGSKTRSPCKQWIPAAFCTALMCCLSLAHAVVLTDGYYKTCDQYRRNLIQLLGSRGREIEVIHDRLACGPILDFMDYLQPDANNWRRGNRINTGLALQLAITCSWFNFLAWILACGINLIMARKRLDQLGERLCCCCC
ncbi:hypothetical protein KM043_003016 [Ampulex compressa]|nr:hypothetical protein KM043_003016 [Ampulex compressa]